MSRIYCTYFNSGFIDRAVLLIRSLQQYEKGFVLEILSYDDKVVSFFSEHPFQGVTTVPISALEGRFPELLKVKPQRSLAEYMFTCMSFWLLDVANRHPEHEYVTYVDCDTRFYADPTVMFDGAVGKDILLSPHYYSRTPEKASEYGYYNAGFMIAGTTCSARQILSDWCLQCLEWCADHYEDGKYAHQLYLNAWPQKYGDRIGEVPNTVNLTPWGVGVGAYSSVNGYPCLNGKRIVQYHFQGVRLYSDRHYYIGHCFHQPIMGLLRDIYEPYIRDLLAVKREFSLPDNFGNARRKTGGRLKKLATGYWLGHPYFSEMIRWIQRLAR